MSAKYRRAVGIQYDNKRNSTPTVGAKAEMELADTLVRLARRYRVPVIENAKLAKSLHDIPSSKSIPERLFKAVAIVLCEVEKILAKA